MSTSKSSTRSLVSSVPFRLPTAHTSFVFEALIRHTTPPLPPLSNVTRFRINSPVFKSQSLTVPSSELVITKFLLNCKQVTALWCLLGPCKVCKHCPVLISQILTVESAFPETRILSLSSIPLVNDWCPVSVWIQFPVSTSQTRIDVSRDPLTTWMPSNYNRHRVLEQKHGFLSYQLLTLLTIGRGYKQHVGQNKEPTGINLQVSWCACHESL